MVLRAGDAKMYLRVYDIALKDENGEIETDDNTNNLAPVTMTFYAEETPEYVANNIKAGDKVEVTKGNGKWAHVLYEGKTGLVKMEYLTAVDTEEEDGAKRQGDAGKAETAQETEGDRETEADE